MILLLKATVVVLVLVVVGFCGVATASVFFMFRELQKTPSLHGQKKGYNNNSLNCCKIAVAVAASASAAAAAAVAVSASVAIPLHLCFVLWMPHLGVA